MKTRLELQDKDSDKFWEISVDGKSHTVTYGRNGTAGKALTKKFASDAEALTDANKLLQEKRKKGYKGASPKKPPPKNANEAVDQAIETLKEFFIKYPQGQMVVELVAEKDAKAALAAIDEEKFFFDMHKSKLGGWLGTLRKPSSAKNSFDYFIKKYGSLTWALSSDIEARTFQMGNVSGGGNGILELGSDFNDDCGLEQIAENRPEQGFETGLVFHGGWGSGGYIMDKRVTSKDGEHPIYYFCGEDEESSMPSDKKLNKKMKVEPFGFWLQAKINEIMEEIEPELKELEEKLQKSKDREAAQSALPKKDFLSVEALEDQAIGERGRLQLLYQNKANGEIWGYSYYKSKFVIYDGAAVVPNYRHGESYDSLAEKSKGDLALIGKQTASLREVFIWQDPKEELFVEIEACGPLLFVRRGWNNGYLHEERRAFATKDEALAAAKVLSVWYQKDFEKVDVSVGKKMLLRELYSLSKKGYVSIGVKGTSLVINGDVKKKYENKAAVMEALEKELSNKRKDHIFKIIEW
jgi:predicted DNA-binding WGR domain protein